MKIRQRTLVLTPKRRGFHLVTAEVLSGIPELAEFERGIAHLFLMHTSASLSLNENADPDVRRDLEGIFDRLVPEGDPSYVHTLEGDDDMPAHAKSSILGTSLTVPISSGTLLLGTWQGVYLCEHRDRGGPRQLAVTLIGE